MIVSQDTLFSILKLIEKNNSWKDSFYRYTGDSHYTPLIKYFSCRYDTRDMECWGIKIDLNNDNKFFRIDTEDDFERLLKFLEVREYDKEKHTHKIIDKFQIYSHIFNVHEVENEELEYSDFYVTVS